MREFDFWQLIFSEKMGFSSFVRAQMLRRFLPLSCLGMAPISLKVKKDDGSPTSSQDDENDEKNLRTVKI